MIIKFYQSIFILLFICFSCSKKKETAVDFYSPTKTKKIQHYLIISSGESIPTGIAIPAQGKRILLDSMPKPKVFPLEGLPKVNPVRRNRNPIGIPTIIEMPKKLRVVTPGQNGVPLPKTVPAIGKVIPALYPKPVPALAPEMKDNAVADIRYLDISHNMSSSSLWTMLEDSKGHLWFGTLGGGVTRYDGTSFTHFTEKEGLSDNHVYSILEDRQGHIWFGTRNGGVCRYNGINFTHFTTEGGLAHNFVLCMLEDSQGNIWFGTHGGASRYDGINFTHFTSKEGLVYDIVISLFEDSQHNIWIGTGSGTGLHRYDGINFTHYNLDEGKGENDIHAIMEDSQGNLWFGTWGGGLTRYDGTHFAKYTTAEGLAGNAILSIMEDKDGTIWLGSMGGGVSRFDGNYFTHYTTQEGLSSDNVRFLTADSQGNIWACTWDAGVNIINKDGFTHFTTKEGLMGNKVQAITKTSQGDLWFGTMTKGFSQYDGASFTHFTHSESIIRTGAQVIFEDSHSNLWLGAGGGVSRFDGVNFIDYTRKEGLLAGDVRAIVEDKHHNLWFGTQLGGVILFDGHSFTHFSEKEGFISDDVYAVLEDSQSKLWFGTLGGGVSSYDGENFIHYTTNEGLSHNYVNAILEDNRGDLWFGTGAGLSRFDGNNFTNYTTDDGLINNNIYSLAKDKQENIWITTEGGISRLSAIPSNSQKSNNLERQGYQFFNFGKEDGLKKTNLTQEHFAIDNQNQIWFGCTDGIKVLNLNKLKIATEPPQQVQLTHIEINQKFIDYRRLSDKTYRKNLFNGAILEEPFDSVVAFHNYPTNISLPYNLNHLTFYFSAIDWAAPQKIRYSYWIDGIDTDWSIPQFEAKVDYRNLPYGTFTLKVKAIGEAQVWSEPFNYTFTINPPWWQTSLAYLLYGIALALISYYFYRFQLSKRLAIEEGNRLKEINQLKNNLYTNITHEFRTPLTIISGMADELEMHPQKEASKKLGLIKKNSHRLLQMVNQMLQLSKLQAGKESLHLKQEDIIVFTQYLVEAYQSLANSKNISLQFYSEEDKLLMDFDAKKLETILTNLLSNAIKFTREYGKILVVAKKITNNNISLFEIQVRDNGIGIAADQLSHIFDRFHQINITHETQGTGIGLALAKELVNTVGGSIEVTSILGKETIFYLKFPIHHKAPLVENNLSSTIHPPSILLDLNELKPEQPLLENDRPILLIIEDNLEVIYYLQACLEEHYQIRIGRNGKEGIDKAFEIIPDIIISDVMMPKMDGFEVCASLKEDERTNHIPIILLTAKADSKDKLTGLSKGADAYLIKPFEKAELLIRLEKLLSIRQILQQKYMEELNVKDAKIASPKNQHISFIKQVEQHILLHLANDTFSVNDLAKLQHLSRSQVHRKIKALTGMPTSIYIRHLRLLKAKELIYTTDLTISEIVYQVGFKSPAYFSQVYKATFGISPSSENRRNS